MNSQSYGGLATPPNSTPPRSGARSKMARHSQLHSRTYSSGSEESFAQLRHVLERNGSNMTTQDSSPEKTEEVLQMPPDTPAPNFLVKEYTRAEQYLQPAPPTPTRPANAAARTSVDAITMHLLVETAMGDSEGYAILSPEELEEVKKEEQQLIRRIDASKRRLFLESRVENTARLLRKLAAKGRKENGIAGSPQHFKLPGLSGLDDSHDSGVEEGEADEDNMPPRFGNLAQEIWRLEKRRVELQNQRLEHTAGVLQRNNELRRLGSQGYGMDDELDFEDADNDSNLSSPRQSIGNLSQLLDGTLEALGGFSDQRERLRSINQSLYDFLRTASAPTDLALQPPPSTNASSSADFAYLEEAVNAMRQRFGQLHDTLTAADHSVTQYEVEHQQSSTMLADLWDAVALAEDNLKRNSYIIRQTFPDAASRSPNPEQDTVEESDIPDAQAIISRIHRLVDQAQSLSQRLLAAKDELAQERYEHTQTRDQHEQENKDLSEQIQLIHDKNLESQRALADAETKLVHNQARVNDMQNMMDARGKQMIAEHEDALSNERAAHQEMKTSLMSQVLEKQAALEDAHRRLAAHESSVSDLRSAESDAQDKMQDLTTRMEELTVALANAQRDAETHQASAESYSRQLSDLTSNKQEVEQQYQQLQAEHEEVAAHLGAVTQKAADHEAASADLTQKLQRAIADRQALQEQLDTVSASLQASQAQLHSTASDHSQHIQQLTEDHQALQALQAQHDRLKAEHSHLTYQLETTENRALEHEAAAQDATTELESMQEQLHNVQQQLFDTQSQLQHVHETAQTKDSALADRAANVDSLESEKNSLEAEVARLNDALEAQSRSQDELEGLRSRYDHLAQELQTMHERAGAETQRAADLEAQLSTSSTRKSESDARVESLQKELSELVTDYETLVREELEVEKEREAREREVDDLKAKVEALETQISDQRIRAMGKRMSGLSERDANEKLGASAGAGASSRVREGTTMTLMRNEFKKMMREARAEHFKSLKAEQEERRRLEGLVRALRKEQGQGDSSVLSEPLSPGLSTPTGISFSTLQTPQARS